MTDSLPILHSKVAAAEADLKNFMKFNDFAAPALRVDYIALKISLDDALEALGRAVSAKKV